MSRSIFGARQIGALFLGFVAFALFAIFVSVQRAAATPSREEPLFAQCGLENLLPASGKEKEHVASRPTREEGRSAIAFRRWLETSSPILPGLLVFGVDQREWPAADLIAAADPTARYCPSGAQL
ncbi:hypothetical protein [Methylosinus sp. Sm6]|uniref:hypothetical protein n=1 Tax=Methylosinus sp. Sm6 TaxID=2866948 RepID=UPI001C995511|nr:hypothetical protein [Methylosinus sp. Sm6]MBY6242991.1 hypothetical protein [Methylosinus sp. Sm6]